jgi:hypothetical protein
MKKGRLELRRYVDTLRDETRALSFIRVGRNGRSIQRYVLSYLYIILAYSAAFGTTQISVDS